jgi:hypothetical protein
MRPNHDWSQQDVDARTPRPEGRNEPDAEHLDKMLDEALRETFPATDPIAITIDKKSCASEEPQGPGQSGNVATDDAGAHELL